MMSVNVDENALVRAMLGPGQEVVKIGEKYVKVFIICTLCHSVEFNLQRISLRIAARQIRGTLRE